MSYEYSRGRLDGAADYQYLQNSKAAAQAMSDRIFGRPDDAAAERDALRANYTMVYNAVVEVEAANASLVSQNNELLTVNHNLVDAHNELVKKHNDLLASNNALRAALTDLVRTSDGLRAENAAIKTNHALWVDAFRKQKVQIGWLQHFARNPYKPSPESELADL